MTSGERSPGDEPVTRKRHGLSVRTWMLAAMFGLSALALVTAGVTAMRLQEIRVEARIDEDLRASAEEFRVLATVGLDPDTGEPFASPEDLVRSAMERTIPGRNEGVLGVVDGEIAYTSRGAPVALEEDAALVDQLAPLLTEPDAGLATVETDTTTYRVAAIPVRTTADGSLAEGSGTSDGPVAALVIGVDLTAELADFQQVFQTYALVAAGSLGVVTLVGWMVAGRLMRPVRVLAASARRIGREDLSERIPVSGNDDLADMTRSVNEMLARLDESFDAQRRLVGDVSHELRTPLTVVRGHLEVMDPEDPADAREVRALVLDEVARMDRVIGDLSLLATADSPQFVRPASCEVGVLTDEILDKAIALGDRRWRLDSRADGRALLDRQRVTQAMLQLAANAVKFSAPGTAVALGSRLDTGTVRMWVTDEGPGVTPEDRERIFERFVRAGDQAVPGSGLGLPIVRAIARAHGGEAGCEAGPVGATFTLMLPRWGVDAAPTEGAP